MLLVKGVWIRGHTEGVWMLLHLERSSVISLFCPAYEFCVCVFAPSLLVIYPDVPSRISWRTSSYALCNDLIPKSPHLSLPADITGANLLSFIYLFIFTSCWSWKGVFKNVLWSSLLASTLSDVLTISLLFQRNSLSLKKRCSVIHLSESKSPVQ